MSGRTVHSQMLYFVVAFVSITQVTAVWRLPCNRAETWEEKKHCTCSRCSVLSSPLPECLPPILNNQPVAYGQTTDTYDPSCAALTDPSEDDRNKPFIYAKYQEELTDCKEKGFKPPGVSSYPPYSGMNQYCRLKPRQSEPYYNDWWLCCEYNSGRVTLMITLAIVDFLLFAWWFNRFDVFITCLCPSLIQLIVVLKDDIMDALGISGDDEEEEEEEED